MYSTYGPDSIEALDFDLTCATRIELYEGVCREDQAIRIAVSVGKLLGGSASQNDTQQEAVEIW